MSDLELKTDAQKIVTDVDAKAASLHASEIAALGYVKSHVLWFVGAICLVVGGIGGYFLHP